MVVVVERLVGSMVGAEVGGSPKFRPMSRLLGKSTKAQQPLAVGEVVVSEAIGAIGGHHVACIQALLQPSRQLLWIAHSALDMLWFMQLMQPSYEQQSVANGTTGGGAGASKQSVKISRPALSKLSHETGIIHCFRDVHSWQGEAGTGGPAPTGAAVDTPTSIAKLPASPG